VIFLYFSSLSSRLVGSRAESAHVWSWIQKLEEISEICSMLKNTWDPPCGALEDSPSVVGPENPESRFDLHGLNARTHSFDTARELRDLG
jgi:hypothetical protein